MNYLNAAALRCPIQGRYPTKDEILYPPRPLFRQGLFKAISAWKKVDYKNWSSKDSSAQHAALQRLMWSVCIVYRVKPPLLKDWGIVDAYFPDKKVITTTSQSIISLLHELAHHLFGESEYHACRWSVWLYQLRFTSAMEQLVWKNHTLVKPSSK